jgi:hypothetical protein
LSLSLKKKRKEKKRRRRRRKETCRIRVIRLAEVKRHNLVLGSMQVCLEVEDRAIVGDVVIGSLEVVHDLNEVQSPGHPVISALGDVELVHWVGGLGDVDDHVIPIVAEEGPAHPSRIVKSFKDQRVLGLLSSHQVIVDLLVEILVCLSSSFLSPNRSGLGIALY